MKTINVACVLLATSFMAGCASLPKCGDQTMIDQPSERIIVYRQRALMGFAVSIPIAIDQCKLGSLSNGSYIVGHFAPGIHEVAILSDFGKREYVHKFEVVAGTDLYLRWSEVIEDVWIAGGMGGAIGYAEFTEVSREVAISELKKLEQFK